MRIKYYPDTDSLYIELVPREDREASGKGSQVVVTDEMVVDLDSEGRPVGIDLHQDAAELVDLRRLAVSRRGVPGTEAELNLQTEFLFAETKSAESA